MSLILDALKKADDKRSETPEHTPKPETVQLVTVNHDAINAQALKAIAIKNWGMLCVCFFLCVLIVVLVYLLIDSKKDQVTLAPDVAGHIQTINRTAASNSSLQNTQAANDNIESLYAQSTPVDVNQSDTTIALQNVDESVSTNINSQQASDALYNNTFNRPKTIPQAQDSKGIKDIRKTSKNFQESIPTIFYSKHNYPIEGEPSVELNKKIRREGDSLENGIFIHAILEDKVVLIKNNQYFSLQARNSWINF